MQARTPHGTFSILCLNHQILNLFLFKSSYKPFWTSEVLKYAHNSSLPHDEWKESPCIYVCVLCMGMVYGALLNHQCVIVWGRALLSNFPIIQCIVSIQFAAPHHRLHSRVAAFKQKETHFHCSSCFLFLLMFKFKIHFYNFLICSTPSLFSCLKLASSLCHSRNTIIQSRPAPVRSHIIPN